MAKEDPITRLQQKAVHVYFREAAEDLAESGISVMLFMKDFELDWTPEMIKAVFRAIGKQKFGVESSADWTRGQLQEIWEEFNRNCSKHSYHLPFPSFASEFDEEFLRSNGII